MEDAALVYLSDAGLPQKPFVKYLGVNIGHLSIKEAFLGPLKEAFRRVSVVANIGLTIAEKVQLLKVWIHPMFLLMARAYVADKSAVSALNNVYCVLFGFDNRGLTCHQLS